MKCPIFTDSACDSDAAISKKTENLNVNNLPYLSDIQPVKMLATKKPIWKIDFVIDI